MNAVEMIAAGNLIFTLHEFPQKPLYWEFIILFPNELLR